MQHSRAKAVREGAGAIWVTAPFRPLKVLLPAACAYSCSGIPLNGAITGHGSCRWTGPERCPYRLMTHPVLGGQLSQAAAHVGADGGFLVRGELARPGRLIGCPLRAAGQLARRWKSDDDRGGVVTRWGDGIPSLPPMHFFSSDLTLTSMKKGFRSGRGTTATAVLLSMMASTNR